MIVLYFSRKILGPSAAMKLTNHEVTQTIRGTNSEIVQAALNDSLKRNDKMTITLDGQHVGVATLKNVLITSTKNLTEEDALKGGFDSLRELQDALKRAGFRFKEEYSPYRIIFEWVK